MYVYDPKATGGTSDYLEKGESRPKKPRRSRLKIKVMLTVLLDYRGIVHYEFFPLGQAVKREDYFEGVEIDFE